MNSAKMCLTALLLSLPLAVSGEPAPAGPAPAADASAAATAARSAEEALAEAARLLRQRLDGMPKRAKDTQAPEEEARARVQLAMVALALDGPAEASLALEPLAGPARPEKLELQRLALAGLAAWSSGTDKSPAARSFEELLNRATAGRRLALRSPALVDRVLCYGKYDERGSRPVRPGETLMAYCEVLNFSDLPTTSGEHLAALDLGLTFEEEVTKTDRRGQKEIERRLVKDLPHFSQVRHRTRSPLRDLHLVIRFTVPAELVPGRDYSVRLTVRDRGYGTKAPEKPAAPADKPEDGAKPTKEGADEESPSAAVLISFRVER